MLMRYGCKCCDAAASRLNDAMTQALSLELDAGALGVNLAVDLSDPVAEMLRGPDCALLLCDRL
jgi:hypothetical protein